MSKEIERPENFDRLPDVIFCPHCSKKTKPMYRRDVYCFSLCFIPLCPCGTSSPYMACSSCNSRVNLSKDDTCSNCNVTTPFDADFCPSCGNNKKGQQTRRLHVE
ncbi:hypothetical protein NGRA_1733 [Nosema granulosis]|uniref:Zinc-ribbon 15 domain-containing protein n=1 Tax=Nosema granulosis TaxID=83296 RepID=A0A9P6GYY5_9MICR|nr:hypothetical protein NGRA_1733 [Nosema granulosis]